MSTVHGLTIGQVEDAVKRVSAEKYAGNVIFNRTPELHGRRVVFTLRVKDSRGPGARLSIPNPWRENQRHLVAACWHVHGDVFDALFDAGATRIDTGNVKMMDKSDNWTDFNVGSMMYPAMMSECCECQG